MVEFDLEPGVWEKYCSKRNGALLGIDIVTKYRDQYIWKENGEFAMADFEGLSLFMAGVFTPRDPALRNVILADRVFLQDVDGSRGVSHQIYVKVEDRDEAESVCTAIDALDFPIKTHTEPAQVALDQALDDLNDMLKYAGYVIVFSALVIFLCIANTISMSTYDRTQEIGILRAMGFEQPRVLRLVLAESVLLSLLGGALGCLSAFGLVTFSDQQLALRGFSIPIEMRPVIVALGIGASLVVGFAGGLIPAFNASRLNFVKSLRNVE